jgi:hypothetical protein
MGIGNIQAGTSSGPITSSKLVKADEGVLLGYLVSSTSSGTIKAYDSATAATSSIVLHDTLTPAAGTFVPCPVAFSTGLYLVIGGTISVVAVYA